MESQRGYTLVSQQLRSLILEGAIKVPESNLLQFNSNIKNKKNGWFKEDSLEKRVQPGSFEPSLDEELFIIDTEGSGIFRPRKDESVYKTLLQIPARRRVKVNITGGYEVKRGHSALIHLNEKINFGISSKFDFVKSSPKSSTGRLFPTTRLLYDYSDSFDESTGNNMNDLDMWLLLQPFPKDLIIQPGLTLNQLWFVKGDAKLTNEEIRNELDKNPLLYDGYGNPLQDLKVTDGLPLTIDLEGKATEGVIGLRMRRNPQPIDLSKKGEYFPEEHFEPILAREKIILKPGNHYLFASSEVLSIPPHLSAELRRHSHEGLEGKSHDAGWIDQGFVGDLVFEVGPYEEITLEGKRIPISRLDLFRTSEIPDKIYGDEIGSNYHGQKGPKTSKHFKPFDFAIAAKNYEKLSKIVLVQDKKILLKHRTSSEGFESMSLDDVPSFIKDVESGFFHSRYDCEEDNLVLQFIPYVLFFGKDETIFSYIRSDNILHYGDKRLFGKHSIGVGGHVLKTDGPDYIKNCLEREALIEETKIIGKYSNPVFAGTLYATDKPVDQVHFGLIYGLHVDGIVEANEDSIIKKRMVPIRNLQNGHPGEKVETETWTKILIPHLKEIYDLSKP